MKNKRRKQWIAMLLAMAVTFQAVGSVALAQSPAGSTQSGQGQTEAGTDTKEAEPVLPERAAGWQTDYETAATQEEADALRNQDETVNLLVTAKECELSGLIYGEIVTETCERLDLSDVSAKLLSVAGNAEIQLKGTELGQLFLHAGEGESISLYADTDTKIPEIILEGS